MKYVSLVRPIALAAGASLLSFTPASAYAISGPATAAAVGHSAAGSLLNRAVTTERPAARVQKIRKRRGIRRRGIRRRGVRRSVKRRAFRKGAVTHHRRKIRRHRKVHRGFRHHRKLRRHYYNRRHRHYGRSIGAGVAALIIGGAIAASRRDYGDRWEACDARYRTFRWSDGTYIPYVGSPRVLCPYLRR